jgi:hypothetical protein
MSQLRQMCFLLLHPKPLTWCQKWYAYNKLERLSQVNILVEWSTLWVGSKFFYYKKSLSKIKILARDKRSSLLNCFVNYNKRLVDTNKSGLLIICSSDHLKH